MTIREARPSDFEAVTRLLELLGRAQVTAETEARCRALFKAEVADGAAAHLVAEEDGAVVGFCSLRFRARLNHAAPQAWIPDLIVAEDARGRGLGRALLAGAERHARARGCWSLVLESGHERTSAHALYERAGMTHAGRFYRKLL